MELKGKELAIFADKGFNVGTLTGSKQTEAFGYAFDIIFMILGE